MVSVTFALALTASVTGTVLDAETGRPIPHAAVALARAPARTVLTDDVGRFALTHVALGGHTVLASHVAYRDGERFVLISRPELTVDVEIPLAPSARLMEPVDVVASRVSPRTSGETASYTIPREVIHELPIDDPVELVTLATGVVVSGGRPFVRGLGFEHVVPLIDGVPARDPLDGEWILPPPDGIGSAELVTGAFDAEYAALAGVLNVRMVEGGRSLRAELTVESDRFEALTESYTRTDDAQLTIAGPTGLDGVAFAAAWKGRLTDTHLAYDHALPTHSFLGLADLGARMSGDQTASLRLTIAPPGGDREEATRKLALTLLHAERRTKPFESHYTQVGWVGYEPIFDRFTTFLSDTAGADSVVWYDAPAHVPVRERRSTLAMATLERPIGGVRLGAHFRLSAHRYATAPASGALLSDDEARSWIRESVTDRNRQTEWFHVTHGEPPEHVDGNSHEITLGTRAAARAGAHALAIGGGATFGRHRLSGLVRSGLTGNPVAAGSFEDALTSFDGFAYVQDTWYSDAFSSLRLGVRVDARRIGGDFGSASATTLSPRIGFHQPMTDVDAIHVQAATVFQFPTYRRFFPPILRMDDGIDLTAQRTRAFEVGIQRHVSSHVVAYANAFVRSSNDVVFSQAPPTEADALFGSNDVTAVTTIVSRGVELTVDHRFHRRVHGQIAATIGTTTIENRETSWSRSASWRGWLSLRPLDGLRLAVSGRWDSGRPYAACIKPRACAGAERYEGRLPDTFLVDLGVRWRFGARTPIRLVAEVRNLLGRTIPTFEFGLANTNVGVGNFIAYYDVTGRTDGYLVDTGNRIFAAAARNPATRNAGRNVRLGIQLSL